MILVRADGLADEYGRLTENAASMTPAQLAQVALVLEEIVEVAVTDEEVKKTLRCYVLNHDFLA